MSYRIKRFSKLTKEERLYSGKEAKYLVEAVYAEIIKLLEFWQAPPKDKYNLGGPDTPHWLDVLSDLIIRAGDLEDCPQWIFFPLEKSKPLKLRSPFSALSQSLLGKTPEMIIKGAMRRVETEKVKGKFKYKELLDSNGGFSREVPDYIHFIKYLSLSLSLGYPEDDYNTIRRARIDYDPQPSPKDEKELREFLEELFLSSLGPNSKIK